MRAAELCSTPFGITAVGSVSRGRQRAFAGVLNAFRHHGCREAHGRGLPGLADAVLNAFRHHGCREEPRPDVTGRDVLMCSTPFGITAVGSATGGLVLRLKLVLNAFRHHGCRESPPAAAPRRTRCAQRLSASRLSGVASARSLAAGERMCSTPFGITAVGRRVLRPFGSGAACAQRLSASRLSGAEDLARGPVWVRVLNAFRHHGCREATWTGVPTPTCCAQRLSASRLSGAPGG